MIFSSPKPRDPIARRHLRRQRRPDSPLQSTTQRTHVSHSSQAFRQTDRTRKQTFQEQRRSSSELPATEARTMGREHERLAVASCLLTPRTITATWENQKHKKSGTGRIS